MDVVIILVSVPDESLTDEIQFSLINYTLSFIPARLLLSWVQLGTPG